MGAIIAWLFFMGGAGFLIAGALLQYPLLFLISGILFFLAATNFIINIFDYTSREKN